MHEAVVDQALCRLTWKGPGFDQLIAFSPFGMAVIAMDGRYLSVNPAYCELYGYSEQDLLGASFTMMVLPQRRDEMLARHQHFVAHGGTMNGEWEVQRRDGSLMVVMFESVLVAEADGSRARLVYVADITQRSRAEAALRTSEAQFRSLFETLPVGIVYHGRDGSIKAANPSALRILGLTLDQIQGRHPVDIEWETIRPDGLPFPGPEHPASVALRTGAEVRDQVMGVRAPGRGLVWINVSATPVWRDGVLQEVYASFEDITARVELAERLRTQACTDFLTGISNRRVFMEALASEHLRLQRHGGRPGSLVILDLDHFKRINDRHGHTVGDLVLQHVTRLMQTEIRCTDVFGRYGGEEFALLLPETGIPEAENLARRLCDCVAATALDHDGHQIRVTVSIGVTALLGSDLTVEAALVRADRALYLAKRIGRNRVETLAPGS